MPIAIKAIIAKPSRPMFAMTTRKSREAKILGMPTRVLAEKGLPQGTTRKLMIAAAPGPFITMVTSMGEPPAFPAMNPICCAIPAVKTPKKSHDTIWRYTVFLWMGSISKSLILTYRSK